MKLQIALWRVFVSVALFAVAFGLVRGITTIAGTLAALLIPPVLLVLLIIIGGATGSLVSGAAVRGSVIGMLLWLPIQIIAFGILAVRQ